jgi:outer membrane protein TolC
MRFALPLLVFMVPASAFADGQRLSLDDVIHIALQTHPRLSAARSRAEGARDLEKSAGGRLLPAVSVSEEYQIYDSPFALPLPIPNSEPVTAREKTTNTFVVAASQPLVGLLRRMEDYQAQSRTSDAAEAGVRVAEAAAREGIQIEYLRMFEATALEAIAKASESELGEQVTVTAARVKAGALTNADLLRVKVAQANARQQGMSARTQATVARANVLSAIGMPPDDQAVEFVEPTSLLSVGAPAKAKSLGEVALQRRPELAQARLAAAAADHQERARFYSMLPEVELEGAFMRIDGQVFAPKNSAFVGIKAQWPIWEWGASWNARRAAAAQAEAAKSDLEAQRRQVLVDVTARSAELEATASAVELAEQTIASAEEAYRVTEAQVRAGAATVTDLLDAQAALTQARLNLTRARYEQAMTRVQLERASGSP